MRNSEQRRWTPRPPAAGEALVSDVVVWSRGRDLAPLLVLFLLGFTALRLAQGLPDAGWWALATLAAGAVVALAFWTRRQHVVADAAGIRRLGRPGWALAWADIERLTVDASRNAGEADGWFRLGHRTGTVQLLLEVHATAGLGREPAASFRRDLADDLDALARAHGVPVRRTGGAAPRRAA